MSKEVVALKIAGIAGITLLGITYFITIRQDSTVLLTLSSIIGGIVGYRIGRSRRGRR